VAGWEPLPGQSGYPPVAGAQDHPKATTAMVLGILGLVLCSFVAPFAWVTGKRTMDEIDASQGRLGGRGMAQAGYVMGIIGTVLMGLALLMVVGLVLLAIVSAGTMSFSGS